MFVLEFVGEVHGAYAGADGYDAEAAGRDVHWLPVEGDPLKWEGVAVAVGRGGGGAVGGGGG